MLVHADDGKEGISAEQAECKNLKLEDRCGEERRLNSIEKLYPIMCAA